MGYNYYPRRDYIVSLVEITNQSDQVISELALDDRLNFTTVDEGLTTWLRFKETGGSLVYEWSGTTNALGVVGPTFSFLPALDAASFMSNGVIGDSLIGYDADYVGVEGLTIEAMVRIDEPVQTQLPSTYELPANYDCSVDVAPPDGILNMADEYNVSCNCTVDFPELPNSSSTCNNCVDDMDNPIAGNCSLTVGTTLEEVTHYEAVNGPFTVVSKDGEFALGVGLDLVTKDVPRWQLALGLTTNCDQGLGYLDDPFGGVFDFYYGDNVFQSDASAVEGVFTHIVAIFDDSASEVDFFINNSSPGAQTITNATPPNCDRTLRVNALGTLLNTIQDHLDSTLAELAVYNRVLDSTEITNYYNRAGDTL